MDDLISRQAAIATIAEIVTSMSVCTSVDECHGMKRMQGMAVRALDDLPSAKPKRGEWKHEYFASTSGDSFTIVRCSNCEGIMPMVWEPSYCPFCGAYMRGEEDE